MPPIVVIDAGHGGERDSGAVYLGREEKNDNLNLALAVGKILQDHGIEVVYTRTTDVYQQPAQKAQIANNTGAEFFCVHSPQFRFCARTVQWSADIGVRSFRNKAFDGREY